jgi:hypothetical protein
MTQKRGERRKVWMLAAVNAIQLKIAIKYMRPAIWRRVVLPDHFTLADLHEVIQITMGWQNCHMHRFEIDDISYTSAQAMGGMDMKDESKVLLRSFAKKLKQKFFYEYDFGDSWIHEITVEKIVPIDSQPDTPVCLAGKRACPPEDCGSYPGYDMLLEALSAPVKTDEQKEMLEWIGDDFDPDHFDLDAVNRWLKG